MNKLILRPDRSGYSASIGGDVLSVRLAGGFGRYRRDFCKSTSTISCTWRLTSSRYKYFRSFYTSKINKGASPFLIDLILDDPEPLEYTAYIVPDTLQVTNPEFNIYEVSCELEVQPIDDYDTGDFASIFEEFGDTWRVFLDIINTETNQTLPSILGGLEWPE